MVAQQQESIGQRPQREVAIDVEGGGRAEALGEDAGGRAVVDAVPGDDDPSFAAGGGRRTLEATGLGVDLELAAEAMGLLVYDRPFRDAVIAGQRKRLLDFSTERVDAQLWAALAPFGIDTRVGPA